MNKKYSRWKKERFEIFHNRIEKKRHKEKWSRKKRNSICLIVFKVKTLLILRQSNYWFNLIFWVFITIIHMYMLQLIYLLFFFILAVCFRVFCVFLLLHICELSVFYFLDPCELTGSYISFLMMLSKVSMRSLGLLA